MIDNIPYDTIIGAIVGISLKCLYDWYKERKSISKQNIESIEKSIDILCENSYMFWVEDAPDDNLKQKLLDSFTELNLIISEKEENKKISNFRGILYDLLTTDMEDKDIFKSKKKIILPLNKRFFILFKQMCRK